MSEASVGSSSSGFRTIGVGVFGEGLSGTADDRLFRVEPGHDAGFVLEQAALLMGCVGKLTQHVMFEQDEARRTTIGQKQAFGSVYEIRNDSC